MTRFPELLIGACLFCWMALPVEVLAHTNEAHRLALLQAVPRNFALARSADAAKRGYVPASTLVFREWALSLMLTQANFLNERWSLGLAAPITSDHVTRFTALAKIEGPEGGIVINGRFGVGFNNGRWSEFEDNESAWNAIERDVSRIEAMTNSPSSIDKRSALTIARETLRSAGIDEGKLKTAPPNVIQREFETPDGKRVKLPLYQVE